MRHSSVSSQAATRSSAVLERAAVRVVVAGPRAVAEELEQAGGAARRDRLAARRRARELWICGSACHTCSRHGSIDGGPEEMAAGQARSLHRSSSECASAARLRSLVTWSERAACTGERHDGTPRASSRSIAPRPQRARGARSSGRGHVRRSPGRAGGGADRVRGPHAPSRLWTIRSISLIPMNGAMMPPRP